MKLPVGWKRSADPARAIAADMVRRADEARDSARFAEAAFLYGEAARMLPRRGDLHIQHGHMLKEAGDPVGAEAAYRRGEEILPPSADLAMQFGHLFKLQGRAADAARAYARAAALDPAWDEPRRELEMLKAAGVGPAIDVLAVSVPPQSHAPLPTNPALAISAALAPGGRLNALHAHDEEIAVRGLGRRERTPWGVLHTLRGVRAFRGFCIAASPVLRIEIFLNGVMVYRGGVKGGYPVPNERDNPRLRKYVFNVWIDLNEFVSGQYQLRYRAIQENGTILTRAEPIAIMPPFAASALPDSDDAVPPADPSDPRSLDEQINARPSMIRPSRRALLSTPPKTVLVQRADVLGDLVVTVPAIRRLRAILPEARIVGLLSPANVDFARTLGLFDEIVLTELLFDPWERRRVVTAEAQAKLKADLDRYDFDMAIDLGTAGDSRLLLPLSGAPVLVGFSTLDLPNLTVEVAGAARDPYNGIESVPHTNQAMGLVEWLAAMMRSEPTLLRRDDLDPALLDGLGLRDGDYIVLHVGGRWEFTRWPYYAQLAEMLLARTELKIVLMSIDPDAHAKLPHSLTGSDRFQLLDRRLAFDELDALLSYCALFIGDDSGVKHLASMRGAKVIGIQNARNNWCEWGHDGAGYIVTRKVPCAGCLIQNYPESDDCGRDFVCITAIQPAEIYEAALSLLAGDA